MEYFCMRIFFMLTRGQTPCEVDTQTKESLSSTGGDSSFG